MAAAAGYEKPPQFEISDLRLQPYSIWPDAVRLVQTYWKQAIVMTPDQRRRYLQFLNRQDLASKISTVKLNKSLVYDLSHDRRGHTVLHKSSWIGFLINATLLDTLPPDYTAAIRKRHGISHLLDFTHQYRQIYPVPETNVVIRTSSAGEQTDITSDRKSNGNLAPSSDQQQNVIPMQKKANNVPVTNDQERSVTPPQKNNIVMPASTGIQRQNLETQKKEGNKTQASTTQQEDHTPPQKKAVDPSPTFSQEQNTTPSQKKSDTLPASIIQQENVSSAGTQPAPTSPKIAQSVKSETWNIGNVVHMLGQVKKKRLSSAPESSPKRVKTNDNEVLDQVNQQATITKSALEKLQSTAEQQGAKLQEVSATAEQNKQTLSDMQSELRHFMSAVASTLRDIQERLEE